MCETGQSLVCDIGSSNIKIGFTGDDAPKTLMQHTSGCIDIADQQQLQYPIENGIITDWNNMERIFQHIFHNELKLIPSEHAILLTECIKNPKSNREELTQSMFETFNCPGMYIIPQPVLSLHSSGRTTGAVVDFGYEQIQIACIYEGYALHHASLKLGFGGKQCTYYLKQLLLEQKHDTTATECDDICIRKIKEDLGYVAIDFEKEMQTIFCTSPTYLISAYLRSIDSLYGQYTAMDIETLCGKYCDALNSFHKYKQYELPDGNIINLGHELSKCTEILFNPKLIGIDNEEGVVRSLYNCIMQTDVDIRWRDMCSNIVLSGGGSMFDGIQKRMYKDMIALAPCSAGRRTKVIAPPERNISAWIGGSIITSSQFIDYMWITKTEYDESGCTIVHRKCF
eukprot:60902_1